MMMIMMVLVLTEEEETKLRENASSFIDTHSNDITRSGGKIQDHRKVNKQEIKHCLNG